MSRRDTRSRPLKSQLEEIAAQFDDLARNQKILGFTESEGIRDGMTKAAAAVERIIHDDMSWMSEADAHKLLVSLLTMRRYEAEYRLTRSTLMQTMFFDEFKKFQDIVEDVDGADGLKQQLAEQVKSLQRHLRRMDRVHRQGRSAGRGDRIQRQEHDSRSPTRSSARPRSIPAQRRRAGRLATADPSHHHRRRHRGRADRARLQLADRPQHRPSAQRPGRSHEAARRRRHLGPHSRHPRLRRDRRHGAHRDRVPRQHDRTRPPDRRTRPSPRARRSSAAKASPAPSPRSAARSSRRSAICAARAAARNVLDQAQRRGRRGDRRVAHRRESRQRRVAERHLGGELGRGAGGLDRRDRRPGREIDRGRRPAPSPRRSAPRKR